jgi:hypothetical protein
MNVAGAAAAASTPSIKGGILLDAFDAKIVQYHCALRKLQVIQTPIKALNIKAKAGKGDVIPLVHHITTICAGSLQMNEHLKRRVVFIGKLEPLKDHRKVVPHLNTSAISFDLEDTEGHRCHYTSDVNYSKLLEDMLSICDNAVTIYQEKLRQSIMERDAHRRPDANHKPVPLDPNSFLDLLEPLEVMSLSRLITTPDDLETCQFKITPILLDAIANTTQNIGTYIAQLQKYKERPSEATLKRLPAWPYTIHRIFASVIKLSDLYAILRRFGRELYLPASNELHAPKLLHQSSVWDAMLKTCDEYFLNPKKNEQMVFTSSRATRQGASFQLKHTTITELMGSLLQSYNLVMKLISILRDLVKGWEAVNAKETRLKLKFNTNVSKDTERIISPDSRKLIILFNPDSEKLSQENIAKQQRERERIALEERTHREKLEKEKQMNDEVISRLKFEQRERQLRAELIKDRSPTVSRAGSLSATSRTRSPSNPSLPLQNRSRSASNASNASVNSNSSTSSMLNSLQNNSMANTPSQPPQPSQSSQSPKQLSRSPSLQRRPSSVYISNAAFDIRTQLRRQEKSKQSNNGSPEPTRTRLRRCSSLSQSDARKNSMITAAAAGALAGSSTGKLLKQERHSSLKTRSEILKERETNGGNELSARNMNSSPRQKEMPLIAELTISTPPRQSRMSPALTPAKVITNQDSGPVLEGIDPSPLSITPTHSNEDFNITPTKSNLFAAPPAASPSIKPLLKPPAVAAPDLVDATTSESSLEDEPKEPNDFTEPKKIVKKVRFIGVPDLVDDPKPKRKGWINPPRLSLVQQNKSRSSLSIAADALQQERMAFSTIKRGHVDVSGQMPDRIMSTLMSGNTPKKGWRIGGKLRDRF